MEPTSDDLMGNYMELCKMMSAKMESSPGKYIHADLCGWFIAEYNTPIAFQNLAATLQHLEQDCLRILGPAGLVAQMGKAAPLTVPHAPVKLAGALSSVGVPMTLRLWHFGFEEKAGVKGSPVLCDVLEVCKRSLCNEIGNDTEKYPLQVLFELMGQSSAGTPLQNFSVGFQMGFGTTFGSLLVCLAAIQGKWLDKTPGMAARLLKCLQLEAIYRPSATLSISITESLASKIQATNRQRPNPLHLLFAFDRQARSSSGRQSYEQKLVISMNAYNRRETVTRCKLTGDEMAAICFLAMALDIVGCAHSVAWCFLVGVLAGWTVWCSLFILLECLPTVGPQGLHGVPEFGQGLLGARQDPEHMSSTEPSGSRVA